MRDAPWAVGERNTKAKLTEKQVMDIRERFARGALAAEISADYSVSESALKCIKRGKAWGHLGGRVEMTDEARERMKREASERRKIGVKARASGRTHCQEGHELVGGNIILRRDARGSDYRICRQCLLTRRNARLRADAGSRIHRAITRAIWGALKGRTGGSGFSRLPYTIADLTEHLGRQFSDGMSWDNYGDWHVDHIKPKVLFDAEDEDQLQVCWALTNLQPLWSSENCSKGSRWDERGIVRRRCNHG